MKLPEITYNLRIQNFATKSPMLPVAEARTTAFGAGAVSAAAQATNDISNIMYERNRKMEQEKAQEDWSLINAQINGEITSQKEFEKTDEFG
ncbi:unnamed protein product, partial [marine sediment metagenome]